MYTSSPITQRDTSHTILFMNKSKVTHDTNLTTKQKALRLNLDKNIYGSFAEIGAGQDVASIFFKAGGASGTVAKTISAYDMTFSDAIYGTVESGRYVCEERLMSMLDHEYNLLIERLDEKRGINTQFFSFANTVVALNYHKTNEAHGWVGMRFQLEPMGEFHDVVIHIQMLDNDNLLQQQALGIVGVNLIYGCFYYYKNPEILLKSLMDNLSRYDLSKVQSILSVSPPYNRPNQRGLYQHYKAFAESTKLPVILYNVPGRTGSNLEATTVLSLAKDVKNIVAVKEASGNLMQMQQIIYGAPKGFKVISGDDALTLPLISLGGIGIISVVANAFPKIMSDAVRFALKNDYTNAQKLHYKLFDLMNLTFEDGNPAGVKGMLSELNLIQNYLRLPLVPVSDNVQEKIKVAIQRINA